MRGTLAVALLLCGAALALGGSDELLAQAQAEPLAAFKEWARMHGREYSTGEEFNRRFRIFTENMHKVVAGNARNGVSYTLGLNGFADLTTEEFRERYFGPSPKDLLTLRSSENRREVKRPWPHSDIVPPARVNWAEEGIITPVKDQHVNGSKCGCCYAFGGIAGVEAANAKFTGQPVSLSEQQIVDCDSLDYGCDGGDFTNVVRYVRDNGGVDTMEDYPYLAREDKCVKHKAMHHKAVTVDGYQHVPHHNETALMQSLTILPTIVAVCCGQYLDQWHLYTGGIFDTSAQCTSPLDHAVLVVGYDTQEDGTQYWLIKNSWGAHWGEGGYMRLLRNVSDPLGQNGLVNLPPAYVVKSHPNPIPHQARRARMSGAQVALDAVSDWLEGWFSSS